ncbi:M20/M25/M40 family metallo-hydrolase [Candidatus Dojkabacteria bacterium]|nr:M20/M25/M40 family metallo-hydrolase [Candidatus Dojkabacteria bacterium]
MKDYKQLLEDFVGIKSVSPDPNFKGEIHRAADWLKTLFTDGGFDVEVWEMEKGNPIVFANHIEDEGLETVLVYGHYDVMPAAKEDGWDTDPFQLVEKDGRLWGRGSVDNKGQVLIYIHTIIGLVASGKLGYNVKFMIEGGEEIGSPNIAQVLEDKKHELESDVILFSDGEMTADRPVIDAGCRGNMSFTVKYKTAKTNLHSGIYGGAIANSANEICRLVSKFHDENGRVQVSGFYDGVEEVTEDELEKIGNTDFDPDEIKKMTGVKKIFAENGEEYYVKIGLQPMLTVTGINSGYTGEGYSNIIPSNAEVRCNVRMVESQDPKKLAESIEKFVEKNTPDYIDWEFTFGSVCNPVKVDVDNQRVKDVTEILEEVYSKKVIFKYCGGSLPIVDDFKRVLGLDAISVGLGNEDCNMHGVNENFRSDLIEKGVLFVRRFFSKK